MHPEPTKVVGRRVGGLVVDVVIVWIVGSVLFALMATRQDTIPTTGNKVNVEVNGEQWVLQGSDYTVWILLILAVIVLIAVVLEGMTGWTPGKLLFGVRVVDAEGRVPGMPRAAARLVGWIVDGILWGLVALIASISSKGNRRLGDMMGGTYVVHKEAVGQTIAVNGVLVGTPGGPGWPSSSPLMTRDAFGNPVPWTPEPGGGPTTPAVPVPRPAHSSMTPAAASPPPAAAPVQPPAPVQPAVPQAPADWYPDPSGKKRLRYWSGSAWTDHTAD